MKDKRIVLVSGASRGIGKAISLQLLEEDFHVIGIARTFEPHAFNHPHFKQVVIDLADLKALPEQLKQLKEEYPAISGLICNAGRGQFKNLEEFSYEQIRSLIELNLMSQIYLTKTFLDQLKKQPQSNIIFIGSEAALAGKKQGSLYCASKFALRGFAQALRDECACSSVRVSLINPGMVQTGFFQDLSFHPGMEPKEHLVPEDIAQAVLMILNAREGAVIDEINLSPQKKRLIKR